MNKKVKIVDLWQSAVDILNKMGHNARLGNYNSITMKDGKFNMHPEDILIKSFAINNDGTPRLATARELADSIIESWEAVRWRIE